MMASRVDLIRGKKKKDMDLPKRSSCTGKGTLFSRTVMSLELLNVAVESVRRLAATVGGKKS